MNNFARLHINYHSPMVDRKADKPMQEINLPGKIVFLRGLPGEKTYNFKDDSGQPAKRLSIRDGLRLDLSIPSNAYNVALLRMMKEYPEFAATMVKDLIIEQAELDAESEYKRGLLEDGLRKVLLARSTEAEFVSNLFHDVVSDKRGLTIKEMLNGINRVLKEGPEAANAAGQYGVEKFRKNNGWAFEDELFPLRALLNMAIGAGIILTTLNDNFEITGYFRKNDDKLLATNSKEIMHVLATRPELVQWIRETLSGNGPSRDSIHPKVELSSTFMSMLNELEGEDTGVAFGDAPTLVDDLPVAGAESAGSQQKVSPTAKYDALYDKLKASSSLAEIDGMIMVQGAGDFLDKDDFYSKLEASPELYKTLSEL